MNRNSLFVFNAKKFIPLSAAILFSFALSMPQRVEAVVTLTDGNSEAHVDLTSDAGMNYWAVDGQNQLVKQWFWYRVGGGVASPINTIPLTGVTTTGLNDVLATYGNGSFSLSVHYLLTGGSAGSGTADIQESISIHNSTGSALDFHFYQYSDFDLLGTGGDSVNVGNDYAVQTKGPTQIAEAVNSPSASHHEGALFNTTLNNLNTVSNLQLNDSDNAGPGDVTWALQWDASIAGGADFDIFKDKLLSITPIPEPSTLALFALGLAGFGVWKRRQKV